MSDTTNSQSQKCPACDGRGGRYWEHAWSDGLGGGFDTCPICAGARTVTVDGLIGTLKAERAAAEAAATQRYHDHEKMAALVVDLYVRVHQQKPSLEDIAAALASMVPDGYLAWQRPSSHGYVRHCQDGTVIKIA